MREFQATGMAPFAHEIRRRFVLESRVGLVALGSQPVLHVEIPADRPVVLIGGQSAFQGLVRKGSKQPRLRFARHCAIAKLQSIHIGGYAFPPAPFAPPNRPGCPRPLARAADSPLSVPPAAPSPCA